MDILNTPIQVAASALVVRNIIEWLKGKGYKPNNFQIMFLSYFLNFLFTFFYGLGYALYTHQDITFPIIKAFLAMILSSLYHDFSAGVKGTQIIFQNPATSIAPAPSTAVPVIDITPPAQPPLG